MEIGMCVVIWWVQCCVYTCASIVDWSYCCDGHYLGLVSSYLGIFGYYLGTVGHLGIVSFSKMSQRYCKSKSRGFNNHLGIRVIITTTSARGHFVWWPLELIYFKPTELYRWNVTRYFVCVKLNTCRMSIVLGSIMMMQAYSWIMYVVDFCNLLCFHELTTFMPWTLSCPHYAVEDNTETWYEEEGYG